MSRSYLDEVERQLMDATERGAAESPSRLKRPRRPRWEWLGVVPAVAAAAAIVVIVVSTAASPSARPTTRFTTTSGRSSQHPAHPSPHRRSSHESTTRSATPVPVHRSSTPPPATPPAPSGPVPAGFGPESFTAISEFTWWVLGTAPCSSPPCTSIVRTEDGGRSFVGIPAPRTTSVTQLRFADAENGFAYGPELWVTHDAGASWHQIDIQGTVLDLEASAGYVYAIVRASNGSGELVRSPVGSDDWITLSGEGDAFGGLWAVGQDVMVESGDGSSGTQDLAISYNAGARFAKDPVPPSVECNFEGIPPVIWAECPTGMMSGVWRSTDGGAHFTGAGGDADRADLPSEPNSAAFAAASPTTAVYGYQQLYRTADGGRTYAKVRGPSGITWWKYLGFTDTTHGVAIGYAGTEVPTHERLYYTTDAGESYHLVTIGPS